MKKKRITIFPKDFFQRNMPIKPLNGALKDSIPLIMRDPFNDRTFNKKFKIKEEIIQKFLLFLL